MVILDTDAVSFLQHRNSPVSKDLQNYLTQCSAEHEIATTVITYEEQTRGWFAVMARARNLAQQITAYQRLLTHLASYREIAVLPFDQAAGLHFERLRTMRLRIGTSDLKIAAIALARGAKLLSRNLRDFSKVPALDVEDWTRRA